VGIPQYFNWFLYFSVRTPSVLILTLWSQDNYYRAASRSAILKIWHPIWDVTYSITDGCREGHHQLALEESTSSSPICKRRFWYLF
jgi:hypothetical protein